MCRHRKHPAPEDGMFMIINGIRYPITGVRVHDFQQDGTGAWQWVDAVRCLQNGEVLVVEENSALVVPAGEVLQFLITGAPGAPLPGLNQERDN